MKTAWRISRLRCLMLVNSNALRFTNNQPSLRLIRQALGWIIQPDITNISNSQKGTEMTRFERACQIWSVLAWAATHRQTLTYSQLAKLIGVPTAGLGQLLEPVQSYCLAYDIPPLTAIVVQQESGLPGSGFTGATASEYAKALASVFTFEWLKHGNPQPEKLEHAVTQRPSNGI